MTSATPYAAPTYQSNGQRPAALREFFVTVDLYLSPKAASGLRKPPPSSRKKTEKRDSIKQVSEDGQKKLREKTSWLSIGRSSQSAGYWRTATCKLSEEVEGCLLNIYIDETILHQSVYVYLLNHTDIRMVDRSLFDRKDCIGIYCVPGQRWSVGAVEDPIFLSFSDSDTFHTWITLLRSYATPEVYGQRVNVAEGGLYRMWRQVEVNCVQGRNMGVARPSIDSGVASDNLQDSDGADCEFFCELYLNDMLSGRTTTKKGIGSLDWHEGFLVSDLPPFDNLEIIVFRERRTAKATITGSVMIKLANFRRGEQVEGWFPVLDSTSASVGIQVGDLRLKLRIDEEIILPQYEYSRILQALNSHNCLDLMNELGNKLKLKDVSTQFISIAVAMNTLVDSICELADREVGEQPSSHNTLFRGNTVLTKTIELCMAWYGTAFLEASVGSIIRKLCADKISIEVDPARSGKNPKDIERNVELLVYWCRALWNSIYAARAECPQELRQLFQHVRKLVEKRCRTNDSSNDQPSELPWQSVSAFCFLRFIVPAILHPHLFGLVPGLPDLPVQRSLTLIAKAIQSLANLNRSQNVQKEEFMRGMKEFLKDSHDSMIDYIYAVSSSFKQPPPRHSVFTSKRSDCSQAIDSMNQRIPTMPTLYQEAIPVLPYLLDISKHLAVISSAVVRRSRGFNEALIKDRSTNSDLVEFCERCYEVEERALRRVSRLACRPVREQMSTKSLTASVRGNVSISTSSLSSPVKGRRSPKIRRPTTAPSASDTPRNDPPALPNQQSTRVLHSIDDTHVLMSSRSQSRLRPDSRFPSSDSANLRRVQTVEGSSPTEENTSKRRGFFRSFLSKK